MDAVLSGNWRLIGRSLDATTVCNMCGAGSSKIDDTATLSENEKTTIGRYS